MHNAPRHHPSILHLVVAFCVSLVAMRFLLANPGEHLPGSALLSGVLWNLELIVAVSTALYLLLRRAEGDFHAVFLVAFGLFACAEGLDALGRTYALAALSGLSSLFSEAQLVFALLALVAAAAENREKTERPLIAATTGLICVGVVRLVLEIYFRDYTAYENVTLIFVLLAVVLCLAFLLRGEWRHPAEMPSETPAEQAKDEMPT